MSKPITSLRCCNCPLSLNRWFSSHCMRCISNQCEDRHMVHYMPLMHKNFAQPSAGVNAHPFQQQLEEYGFSFEACSLVPGAWSSKLGVSRIFSTSSSKACETAKLVLALVSTKRHPCWRANSCPCSLLTCLCDSCICSKSMLKSAWCLGKQCHTVSQY